MSQLGKRKRQSWNSFEEQTANRDQDRQAMEASQNMLLENTKDDQEPDIADPEDDTSEPSTVGPEVSESLLENDSVLPSSESEYFPTPEKRQRVAICTT